MKLNYVEMAGFRSCREKLRINFGTGLTVVTGRNGVGKSTIMDAVEFVLTGTISKYKVERAKGGGLAEHTWWIGELKAEESYVEVGFVTPDGEDIRVKRTPRGTDPGLESLASLLLLGNADGSLTLAKLCQTMILRDEQISELSLDLTERQRFQAVLDAISPDTAPDIAAKLEDVVSLAKTEVKEARDEQESLKLRLSNRLEELAELRGTLPDEKVLESAEAGKRKALVELNHFAPNYGFEAQDAVPTFATYIAAATELRERIDRELRQSASGSIQQDKLRLDEIDALKREQAKVIAELGASKDELTELISKLTKSSDTSEHLAALLEHGESYGLDDGHCPLCLVERSDDQFHEAIDRQKARVGRAAQALAEYSFKLGQTQRQLTVAQSELGKLEVESQEIEERTKKREIEKARLAEEADSLGLSEFLGDPLSFDERLQQIRHSGTRLRESETRLRAIQSTSRLSNLEGEVAKLRSRSDELAGLIAAKDAVLERAKNLNNLAKAFPKEILEEQFETVMPLLKELYRRLRPHIDWREIEYDFGGKVIASLNFQVGDGKNPQFLFSSGQRRATGLAFLLAVHLSREWTSLRTLMLDDPVQHIDDYRALNLVEVLAAIRKEDRQLIVAVEDPSLADLLARRLRGASSDTDLYYEIGTAERGGSKVLVERALPPLPDHVLVPAVAS